MPKLDLPDDVSKRLTSLLPMPTFIVPNETIVLTMQQRKLRAPDTGQSDRWKSYPYGDGARSDRTGSEWKSVLACLYAEGIFGD